MINQGIDTIINFRSNYNTMKIIKGNFKDRNVNEKKKPQSKKEVLKRQENPEGSYSAMLIDLIRPYVATVPDEEDLEDILQIGIVGWNMAVSKSTGLPGFNEMFQSVINETGFNQKETQIVKEIMKLKQQKYAEYSNFIENYELKETDNGERNVVVTSKAIMDFAGLAEDDESDEGQYEPGFLHRNAILLKYKATFLQWAKKTDADTALLLSENNTIYLIEEKDSPEESAKWLKKNFKKILISELSKITKEERKWPALTFNIFSSLFTIEFHNRVMDLEAFPLLKN